MRQFEPAVIEATAEVQVDPGDTLAKVVTSVKKTLRSEIDGELQKLKVERKESFTDEEGLDTTA